MHHCILRGAMFALVACPMSQCSVEYYAYADTESPTVVLGPAAKKLVVGPGMNATGVDLRGCEFITQDLTRAVFDGCNLYGARIVGCTLSGASFRNAVFTGANVEVFPHEKANFTDATINGAESSRSEGFSSYNVVLSPTQLMSTWSYKNKDLHQCIICGSNDSGDPVRLDFRQADLRQANLRGNCSKCDFTDARVFRAFFGNGSITFEQLASTRDFKQRGLCIRLNLSGPIDLPLSDKWDFSRINLKGSDLSWPPRNAEFTDAKIEGCTIRRGLTRTQLYSTASYKHGTLAGLRLVWSSLSGCDLSGVNLTDCMFSHCKFADTIFEDAVITGVRFVSDQRINKADQLTGEQIKSTWNYKHGRMAGITLPDEVARALSEKTKVQGIIDD